MAEPAAIVAAWRLVVGRVQILVQKLVLGHCTAPFSTWAMWMNFIGDPARSAQPF